MSLVLWFTPIKRILAFHKNPILQAARFEVVQSCRSNFLYIDRSTNSLVAYSSAHNSDNVTYSYIICFKVLDNYRNIGITALRTRGAMIALQRYEEG
jgi:hypothetical protein